MSTTKEIKEGDTVDWWTPSLHMRGTVLALGGGFILSTGAIVCTDRVNGEEVEVVGRYNGHPFVLRPEDIV
jgi:hypothetical protein